MLSRIIILNGPNLNLLGTRQPEIYGSQTFDEYLRELRTDHPEVRIEYFQSNHEGQLIDWLHGFGFMNVGIILNAGGYSHTSIALRDAVSAISAPVIEVHISDITSREAFRHLSHLTDVCADHVIGKGIQGYSIALKILQEQG